MKNLAIIPARGGSKRIPRKNIKEFLGRPIIVYSIEAALKSSVFDEIMVSTDDYEIADSAKKFGAKVPFMRSTDNSNDYAGLAEVCIEVISNYQRIGYYFDTICCILPTAPFVNSEKILIARKKLDSGFNCVFPVVEYSYPVQRSLSIKNGYVEMKWPEYILKRSQDLEKTYHDAGQFYFIKTSSLLEERNFFVNQSYAIIMNDLEVQDIDTETDWKLAEIKFNILSKI